MALVVDAQATASDSVATHNNPIISSLDPISARAQLRTAAPADIGAMLIRARAPAGKLAHDRTT